MVPPKIHLVSVKEDVQRVMVIGMPQAKLVKPIVMKIVELDSVPVQLLINVSIVNRE